MPRFTLKSLKKGALARPPPTFTPSVPLTETLKAAAAGSSGKPSRPIKPLVRTMPAPERSIEILDRTATQIEEGKPHFKVGSKQIFLPTAKVVLLRPNAKHTPYQAKFVVPRYFNRLDLRDYLYHVYGLRALNVTTQLLWARWSRQTPRSPRYRSTQIKKMTIDMAEPFVWPEQPTEKEFDELLNLTLVKEFNKFNDEVGMRVGSDRNKPVKAFGGLLGPFPDPPQPFVPKIFKKNAEAAQKKAAEESKRIDEEELVKKFLRL